ncbi:hypothetical protein OS493_001402 [Desmophyllum pertusum]|uniref:Uncharacterized protein n=1 Tax=Desmophyllum pertusum TaxID=174260 RepID=A0A9X0D1D0_9CNID|nr:hypothetical protein OS493_001402 [Desmophyllum pertusum]
MAGAAPVHRAETNGSIHTISSSSVAHSSGACALNEISPPGDLLSNVSAVPKGFVLQFQQNIGDTEAALGKATKMYLDSLAPGTLRSVIDARQLFIVWHAQAHPGTPVAFPLPKLDIKAFVVALAEAGFSYPRIMNNLYKGLGMWQISNNHPSPATMFPELGATISKYLKKAIGNAPILPKDPMFQDDFEHILDVLGLDNPATMQLAFIHAMSAHSGARVSSMAQPVLHENIRRSREDIGLDPYPEPTGMLVGDVKFVWDDALGLSMTVILRHEKNDAANRSHRRSYTFSPLQPESPYCTASLGFLHLARRGVFVHQATTAWQNKLFDIKESAKSWPLLCAVDTSTQALTNNQLTTAMMANAVKKSIADAGFDEIMLSHRSYRSGFATSDTSGLLVVGLRSASEREDRLRAIPSAYNYRLILPQCNIHTEQDAVSSFKNQFEEFLLKDTEMRKALEEDPVDNKKVNRTKKAATKKCCLQKTREQHEERRAQPPGPPKPETSRKLNIDRILEQWKEDVAHNIHLDIRTRWIPPEGYNFPNEFLCPFRGCDTNVTSGEQCSQHVKQAGHPR